MLLASVGLMNALIFGTMAAFQPLRFEDITFNWRRTKNRQPERKSQSSKYSNLEKSLLSQNPGQVGESLDM
jgi:hypothetical protein